MVKHLHTTAAEAEAAAATPPPPPVFDPPPPVAAAEISRQPDLPPPVQVRPRAHFALTSAGVSIGYIAESTSTDEGGSGVERAPHTHTHTLGMCPRCRALVSDLQALRAHSRRDALHQLPPLPAPPAPPTISKAADEAAAWAAPAAPAAGSGGGGGGGEWSAE